MIMNGQELKRILQGMGIKQVDLAQKMGTTQQNLSHIFKAGSVKTSRLEEIATALGKDISMFFQSENAASEIEELRALLRAKDSEIAELKATNQRLIGIIEKMQQ
jgi:transcriptional regulator with XRE-family HTH domain